jgi:uncharacterized protein (DUF1501 family)
MSSDKFSHLRTRRDFFRQASCAAVGTLALTNTIRDLRLINSAVAANTVSGYKALVCIFLAGGNDANNWVVPTDATTYGQYSDIRANLTLPQSSLFPLYNTGTSGSLYTDTAGHTYGFHPSCPELQTLFGEDKLAVLFNVGTLVRPTTRTQYLANTKFYTPPQLFSHSDQVTQWQTSIPDAPPTTGWGGRVADLLDASANVNGSISMSVSVNGANTFEIGNLVSQYQVSTTGAVTPTADSAANVITPTGNARIRAMKGILGLPDLNLQRSAYADVVENAIAVGDLLNTAISPTVLDTFWTVPFPNTTLGNQLKMVARLIQARGNQAPIAPAVGKFNMNRQIFFCGVGGYDTHTSQVSVNGTDQPTNANGAHYKLLDEVSACMLAFQRAMEQIGTQSGDPSFSSKVTTFTASDFSRTLPTNSQGSDHGWGAHHLIMGGAVNGGQTYGKLPTFAINGPDDTGLGRWIPSIAVDQYSATLAKWFGVEPGSTMTDIFPNLTRFGGTQYPTDLGFML